MNRQQRAQRNKDIRQKAEQGATNQELQREYGLTQSCIYQIIGHRKEQRAQRNAEIREKAEQGATSQELQREYQLGKTTIWRIAKKETNRPSKGTPQGAKA